MGQAWFVTTTCCRWFEQIEGCGRVRFMRIDFVITELNPSGAERCLTEVACGLAASGHGVRVFAFGPLPQGEKGQLVASLQAAGIPVSSGNARSHEFIRCYRELKVWLRDGRADICQTFLFHANVLGTFAARAAGVGVCVGGIRVAEKNWWRTRLEMRAARQMDHLVCVSHAVADFAAAELRIEAERLSVIPNAVDVTRFSTARPIDWSEFGWPRDSDVTIFVGRLHPQKGLELLQRQIDAIVPANTNQRLLLVGDGPLRARLERWAETVGRDRVQLVGWRADIASLLKSSRMLVLPSHYEGMPNVVLEAFAAGIPVVCSRVEGSQELVSHARESQSFEAGDAAEMAAKLNRFASDRALCHDMGESNLARAKRDFSIPAMVEAYASLYRTL